MGLGDNIRYLRIKHGFSQEYIAEKLGYKSYTTIQKWESGVSEPPVKKLKELSVLLKADMNDMANKDLTVDENTVKVQKDIPKILQYYNSLNDIGKHEATKRVEELTYISKYTNSTPDYLVSNAAHQRTDIEIPTGIDISENDIMDDENF